MVGPILYISDRGKPLMYTGAPQDKPVLTVENYTKWYHMYLVNPDGSVDRFDGEKYPLPKYEGTEWSDHIPHPAYYRALCDTYGLMLADDEAGYQLILGRYADEVINTSFAR